MVRQNYLVPYTLCCLLNRKNALSGGLSLTHVYVCVLGVEVGRGRLIDDSL